MTFAVETKVRRKDGSGRVMTVKEMPGRPNSAASTFVEIRFGATGARTTHVWVPTKELEAVE